MKKLQSFVYADKNKCIGCRACEVACSAVHSKKTGKTIGAVQGEIMPRLFFVQTKQEKMLLQCHHCEAAPCRDSCASGAIRIREQNVIVDEVLCTGCKSCVLACPFGVIEIMPTKNKAGIAWKCDLCYQRDEGPACIEVCPMQALRRVDPVAEAKQKRIFAAQTMPVISQCAWR